MSSSNAFKNCSSLETLYISRFASSNVNYTTAYNTNFEATTAYKNISNNCIVYVNKLEYDPTFGFALTDRNHADSQFPNSNNIRRYLKSYSNISADMFEVLFSF